MNNLPKNNNNILSNVALYNKEITYDISEIMNKFGDLIIEYFRFVIENQKLIILKNFKFIIIRGLKCIINVFNYFLLYTKNLNITYLYGQKAYFYYVEFISQITGEDNVFLQLTSRDTMIYVYKKTIYEIPNDIYKNVNNNIDDEYTKLIIYTYNFYVKIYENILIKTLTNDILNTEVFDKIENIFRRLNKNKINSLNKISEIINIISFKLTDINIFLDLCLLITDKNIEELNDILYKISNNFEDTITCVENILHDKTL